MLKGSRLWTAVCIAAVLWFVMFSPWTSGVANFWVEMSCSAVILTTVALAFSSDRRSLLRTDRPLKQFALGVALAVLLWGVFYVGDKLSSLMFNFARPQVDSVYAMKSGLPAWAIGILLLFVIGPAEEFFWRGFVQRNLQLLFALSCKRAPVVAFVVTTLIYTLIHIWSFNFMLVMAAMVAGCIWGFIYMKKPDWLPALIISHALWDALVFVVFPI